ncbi:Predicted integral membrane protein [Mycoplasma suis KI3806]|uniref:Predicted integral membrane protein n=1 Tax=Mycoplasma suis (strain KI_3806) TaxID=708248 RepID=F0V293_MYCS3|nr:lysylphosphatidylglycerol synthase domain-containing protein [Mycoplasma suis]CBZ40774.1 Predicted integral membrane protein [Mycoplasma suis KI3806]
MLVQLAKLLKIILRFQLESSCQCEYNYLEKWCKPSNRREEVVSSLLVIALKKLYQLNKKYFVKIWACLFILAVFLNLFYLQPIKWEQFQTIFSKDKTNSSTFIAVLVFGIFFFVINDIFLAKFSYSGRVPKIGKDGKEISALEWLKLHSISFLIRSVTPFSIGSEPYIIWWLKKRGIPLGRGASIVSSLTVSWFLAQGIITWPSFIYLHAQGNWTPNEAEHKYYWMMLLGLLVDFVSAVFVFSISYSKRVHYFFAMTKYKLNSFLKLGNSQTICDIKWKYINNKKFKKNFKRVFFNVVTFRSIIVFTIQNILNYSLFSLISAAMSGNWDNFFNNFHIINISTTSNNFVPTPGSEGSIQFTINKMTALTSTAPANGELLQSNGSPDSLSESIFLWRWSQKYQPLLLSSLFLSSYYIYFWIKSRIKQSRVKKDTYPELTSLYTVNDSLALRS